MDDSLPPSWLKEPGRPPPTIKVLREEDDGFEFTFISSNRDSARGPAVLLSTGLVVTVAIGLERLLNGKLSPNEWGVYPILLLCFSLFLPRALFDALEEKSFRANETHLVVISQLLGWRRVTVIRRELIEYLTKYVFENTPDHSYLTLEADKTYRLTPGYWTEVETLWIARRIAFWARVFVNERIVVSSDG